MKKLLLIAAVLVAAMQAWAAPVDLKTAQIAAQNFVQSRAYGGHLMAPLSGEVKLAHAEMNSKMLDRAVYYVFNAKNGYVIVSGDDRAEQILGYGDSPIDFNTIPCNMRAWLDGYKEAIEYLQANEGLQVTTPSMMAPSLQTPSVPPLLTALWDQEAPYWNQCKINGYQCLTGCPATSAAMVFHYWKYPDYPTPEIPAYRCELSTSSWGGSTMVNVAALPSVTFDWDNMLDVYTSGYSTAQGNAVATLMRYVGQAEHMAYGVDASGIDADSVELIVNAFKLLGYDEETVRMVKKTSSYSGGVTLYTDAEWAALIQQELVEERPIVFCAISSGWFGGGHAFNVDGYDATTNKYHINFGWSGSSNNYYALNAFDGYNQYQQMVIGIQPPLSGPRLKADKNDLVMTCYKNKTVTATINLNGRNLEGDVTLTLNDENGIFSIDQTTLSPDEDNRLVQPVTVTYAPLTEGEYTATLTISSPGVEDLVINLKGVTNYELYRPVMLPVDEQTITATSFRADWTDETPAENVVSYTLEVQTKPAVNMLTEADWSGVPSQSTNHASDASNYMPEGWTFSGSEFYLDGGFINPNHNSVITANCDMSAYDKVSVIVYAKCIGSGISSSVKVATNAGSKNVNISRTLKPVLVVINAGTDGKVTFTAGTNLDIQKIKIYGGEIVDMGPFTFNASAPSLNDDGDFYRIIEGITPDKFYNVTSLPAGGCYFYRVKALYVNDTESNWSNYREVTLLEGGDVMYGDIDGDGAIDMDDLTVLINYMLTGDDSEVNLQNTDVDQSGNISMDDITELINLLLTSSK